MAKKNFQENNQVSFEASGEKLDLKDSIIPDMECQEAKSAYDEMQEKDDLNFADLLQLMRHLAYDEPEHQADCPFYLDGALSASRQKFRDKMS